MLTVGERQAGITNGVAGYEKNKSACCSLVSIAASAAARSANDKVELHTEVPESGWPRSHV